MDYVQRGIIVRNRKQITILIWSCLLALSLLLPSFQAFATGGRTDLQVTDLRSMEGWPAGPEVIGESAYLVELNSGEVLYSKNENEQRYPASITKVVTALVVIEHCDMNEEVTFSKNAVTDIEDGGHSWEFKEGEVLTVEQCLYALLLESVNEAGYALAEHVSGSLEAFAERMNQKAAEVGATNTHFKNPHGLNDAEHLTTAHDMAMLFWAALQNEKFYEIDSATSYSIPATTLNPGGYNFTMHHKMMLSGSDYYYDGVKAGKTGYTSLAKNTLVTYAEKDGMELVCVVLKDEGGGVVYEDTRKLLDYGFENFRLVDMTATSRNFCNALDSGYPMPLELAGESKIALPKTIETITMEFAGRQEGDSDGIVGNLLYRNGSLTLGSNPIQIQSGANLAATSLPSGSGSFTPEETSGESSAEETTPASTTAAEEKTEEKAAEGGWSFWTWLLVILLVLVGALAIFWIVIQILKARRRRLRKKRRRQNVSYGRRNKRF